MYFTQVIVAKHVTGLGVLFLVQFNNFDCTTIELHALILKPPVLMRSHVDIQDYSSTCSMENKEV